MRVRGQRRQSTLKVVTLDRIPVTLDPKRGPFRDSRIFGGPIPFGLTIRSPPEASSCELRSTMMRPEADRDDPRDDFIDLAAAL